MKRRQAAITIALCLLTAASVLAEPVAVDIPDTREYVKAMRSTLQQVGVRVSRIDSPRDQLLVDYRVADDGPLPEFALAAVLRLVEPVADDADTVHVRNMSGGRKLLELTVRPEEIASALASAVGEAELAEIDELLQATLQTCGIDDPDVPKARLTPDTRTPAEVIKEGREPIGGPELPALSTQRITRPGSATDLIAVADETEREEGPKVEAAPQVLAAELADRLIADDLENVSVARTSDGEWLIDLENRTWRSDIDALAVALEDAANVLPPASIILQLKRHGAVVSHVRVALADYAKLRAGLLEAETLAEQWDVQAGPATLDDRAEILAEGNDSYWRTDLLFRPAIDYTIGLENDPFESDYFIVGNARTTMAPGVWANLRFPAQLTSDQGITMDRALATWVGRPIDGLLTTGSVGKFRDDLHGYYGEARTDTETHQFGLVGSLTNRDFTLDADEGYANVYGYYQYDWGDLGLKTRLGYGQFLESGDRGAALSLRRRFDESVIEARAVRTDDGDEGLTFEVSVPLGPRKASAPDDFRLRSDTAFKEDYVSAFNTQGDYLQGPHDLEAFRGELSPDYIRDNPDNLYDDEAGDDADRWPAAPSFEGTSGLIRIPTADVARDGRLFTGISYLDQDHSKVAGAATDAMPTYIGAGFLPNLEIVGRLTFFHDVKAFDWNYNLDRSMNLHLRLTDQNDDWLPAVAVGAQDVTFGTGGSYLGDAEYLVGTWREGNMRAHLGLGNGKFDPVFAGLEFAVPGQRRVHLMADYDSDYVNAAARLFLGNWGTATVSTLGMEEVTGSVTFHTDLD